MTVLEFIGIKKVSSRGSMIAQQNVKTELTMYTDTTIIPKDWRGIFQLKDTKAKDDFASMESSDYDPETGIMMIHPARPGTLLFRGGLGLVFLWLARFVNLTYIFHVHKKYLTPRVFGINIPSFIIKATFTETDWDPKTGIRIFRRDNYFLGRFNLFQYTLVQHVDTASSDILKCVDEFTDLYDYHTSTCSFVTTDILHIILNWETYVWLFKRFQLTVMLWYHCGRCYQTLLSPFTYIIGIVDLVLLIMHGGDRRRYFRSMRRICGGNGFPYGYGVMRCSYQDVKAAVNSGDLKKGSCIGTSPVCVPEAFASNALIFLSGDEHKRSREIFERIFRKSAGSGGFNLRSEDNNEIFGEFFSGELTKRRAVVKLVTKYILVALLKIPLDQITESDIALICNYEQLRLFVFMPRWIHRVLFNKYLKQVEQTRKAISLIIGKSPLLTDILTEMDSDDDKSNTVDQIDFGAEVLEPFTDVLLFAGVVGTSHLVHSCLNRIQTSPNTLVEKITGGTSGISVYDAVCASADLSNITVLLNEYIVECARLDPPVTSVNTVVSGENGDNREFECMGNNICPPQGFPIGWCISEAHSDNRIFNCSSDFDASRDFSEAGVGSVLAWNGTGVRTCLGRHISQLITSATIQQYVMRCSDASGQINRIQPSHKVSLYEKTLYKMYTYLLKRLYVAQKTRFDTKNNMCFSKMQICKKYNEFDSLSVSHDSDKQDKVYKYVNDMFTMLVPITDFKSRCMTNIEYYLRQKVIACGCNTPLEKRSKFQSVEEFEESTTFFHKELNVGSKPCPFDNKRTLETLYLFFTENMGLVTLEPLDPHDTTEDHLYKSETLFHFDDDVKIRDGFQELNYKVLIDTGSKTVRSVQYNGVEYVSDGVSTTEPLYSKHRVAYAVNGILTAAITRVVLYEHFFFLHKFVAESHTIATEYTLSQNHPLFRIMHPHTFNVVQQNVNASYALFDSKPGKSDGMLSNFFALDSDAYSTIVSKAYQKYSAKTFVDNITGVKNSCLSEDAAKFMNIFKSYVRQCIDILYETDDDIDTESQKFYRAIVDMVPNTPPTCTKQALTDTIATFMFGSSVVHEIVGTTLIPHYLNPRRVSTALTNTSPSLYRPHNGSYSSQAVISNVAVFATGLHSVSLRTDFSKKMFDKNHVDASEIAVDKLRNVHINTWQAFEDLDVEISQANDARVHKQEIINMDKLEYSIAT